MTHAGPLELRADAGKIQSEQANFVSAICPMSGILNQLRMAFKPA